MTNGTSWDLQDIKMLLPTLIEVFTSNVKVRSRLALPVSEPAKSFSMSSTCSLCSYHSAISYSCSHCLAIYCAPSVTN